MNNPERPEAHRVLALLWHAPHQVIAAGGFRRTYEIFERAPDGFEIVALDDNPTFLKGIANGNVRVVEYSIPAALRRLERKFFWVERALEWLAATLTMCRICAGMRRRGERFDVVFVPSSEQLPALLAGILARRLFSAPLVACNLNIDIFPKLLRGPVARMHNMADAVIAISRHLEHTLRAHGVRSPVLVNRVGLDTGVIDRAISGIGPATKEHDAVFVGRHDTEKGVFDLLEIWRRVVAEIPGAKLVMIGSCNPTNRARLESYVTKNRMAGNVTLAGIVEDAEKYSLIKRSKVCLFPSYVEEWGLVPQEALACGLPAVVYDLPVYHENIAPCEAVFRLRPGDTAGMAGKVIDLLENDAYLGFESVGPEYVRKFGWDEVAAGEFRILAGAPGRGRE